MHDYDNYRYYANGKIYKLTETENELLYLFIKNKNHIVTRDMICQRLYLENFKEYQNASIWRNVNKLKKKYGLHIVTMRGRGYILREEKIWTLVKIIDTPNIFAINVEM